MPQKISKANGADGLKEDIQSIKQQMIRRLNGLPDDMARFDYLIMEGMGLPEPDASLCTDEKLVEDCKSKVWLDVQKVHGCVQIRAYSPSLIVRGLLVWLLRLLNGRPCGEVQEYSIDFFDASGLAQALGQERRRGMEAILKKIKASIK